MIEIKNKEECSGCHACYNACPVGAIKMEEDEKGFRYPVVDKKSCIECGLCKKVCPNIIKKTSSNIPVAYAVINKDEKTRMSSSSGGIFNLLAKSILEKKGVVFGASYNENNEVAHKKIENESELKKLQTSKYVQSVVGDTYRQVKDALNEGKFVLFTGTPCQVEGLQTYLKKGYDKLYTQDIICHGVPSPKVWREYVNYRIKKDKIKPTEINFRSKSNGWMKFKLAFRNNDKTYYERAIRFRCVYGFIYPKLYFKTVML